ncbi:MAG: 3-phosphoshikimate 1-carboxyvinyltransferase [Crocinitomicaceae bacterium]|nr:3-phosphoshikimate 1-carboxyvinyltransferase [Crocinitomicaceae bacterium]
MEVKIHKSHLPKEVAIPPSKSLAQRYILAAALSESTCQLFNTGNADDVKNLTHALQLGGASIQQTEVGLVINGKGLLHDGILNCGESGLATRLIIPVMAARGGKYNARGEGSILKRSMSDIISLLKNHGVHVMHENEFLPFQFDGKLVAGNYTLDGSAGSQYLSGLLMALPLLENESIVDVINPTSTPYIDLTLHVLHDFGIEISKNNYTQFTIRGKQKYQPIKSEIFVEGDYSGASFWITAGALSAEGISIYNLKKNSLQGDRILVDVAQKSGAKIEWKNDELFVQQNKNNPFEFDATDVPDLFPPLVVLAAAAQGESKIHGIKRLFNKESNRALVLQKEFLKCGLQINLSDNTMHIIGTGKLQSATIDANHDHRIAMSAAVASLLSEQDITVTGAEAVNKSYPDFWNCWKK